MHSLSSQFDQPLSWNFHRLAVLSAMGPFQGMRRPFMGVAGFFSQRQQPSEDAHIRHLLEKIMHTLEETLAAVQAEHSSVASITTLLTGIKKQLDAALGGALTPSQQMRVDAIFNEATAAKQEIDDAVKANTETGGDTGSTLVPTQTSITSSLNPANAGDSITLSGGVAIHPDSTSPAAPTGSITFFDGSNSLGTANIDSTGVAALASTSFAGGNLAAGDHQLHATYSGDANYAGSDSDTLVQTIAAPPSA